MPCIHVVLSQCPCHLHLVSLLHTRTFKQLSIEALLIVTIYNNLTSLCSRDYNHDHNHPEKKLHPHATGWTIFFTISFNINFWYHYCYCYCYIYFVVLIANSTVIALLFFQYDTCTTVLKIWNRTSNYLCYYWWLSMTGMVLPF